MEEMAVPEGYRFRPNKYEAINYLRRRVNHQPQPCNLVKEMDVYDIKHPSELFLGMKPKDTELFCFTTLKPCQTCASRSQRKTLGGTWKEQGSITIENPRRGAAPAVSIGLKTSFSFLFKNGGKEEPHRYIMHQYSLPAAEKCRVVFCKIRIEDKKGGRSTCYRRKQEVNMEQQQQSRNYEEEQQVVQAVSVSSSSSFVEGGGPSSATSFPPAGHQDIMMSNNFVNNSSNCGSVGPAGGCSSEQQRQQPQQQYMMNYYPSAAASSECTTYNTYEVQASSSSVAVFSADIQGTTPTTNFVNNNNSTVELPGEYYYLEEEQQFDQQQYMKYNEVQEGLSFFVGDPSSMVFSTDQGATHFHENAEMLNNNGEEELRLLMQHMAVPPPPPPPPEIRETNENYHHQAQAPPRPQTRSDKRLVQGEGTLSEWIMAQSEEWK